jgi:hypothetical protein
MDEERHGDDGAANLDFGAADAAKGNGTGDAGVARDPVSPPNIEIGGADVSAAISGKITYSLTIEQAQERFARARRKVPKTRTLQRYCEEGLIKGLRQSVSYDGGTHGKPWFINEESLADYIKKQPIFVLGDDGDANDELAAPKTKPRKGK